nr:ribonuclease H-like domain-containing protein [Tanacetum cinerariifolium]
MLDMKNEIKAKGTLLMALPNKDQLKFHSYQDAKLLMEAIEKRYGGNKESKKVQRTLLKKQYENFAASSSETLDQTFVEIETISLDDLHNNLKIYEPELTRSSVTSQNLQTVAFVSSNSTNSTSSINEADNTAYGVSTAHIQGNAINSTSVDNLSDAVICAFLTSQPNSSQLSREDLEQIDLGDLEEMDLNWEMAMLTIRARRGREYGRKTVPVENSIENALIAQDGIGVSEKDKTGLGYKAASPAIENFVNSSKMIENQENVRSRSDKGYHAVPPSYTGNYIPPKHDLMFIDEQVKSEYVDVVSTISSSAVKTVESKVKSVDLKNKGVCSTIETKPVRENNFSPPIIKDWISDDESEVEFEPKVEDKIVRPSIEKIKFVKTARETKEKVETPKQHKHYPRGNQRN